MTARGRVDRGTAKAAALNYALLLLVLRSAEPLSRREFDAVAIAVAVLLAVAQRRQAGGRRG
jgi:hypothetical protein